MKYKKQRQKHEVCKMQVQTKHYYENMKIVEHNYGARLYLKFVLNILKVT